ncbi:MAG: hypothetical protein LUQ65_12490 [Candidatus Helarchaeota archaeon]|nr:hypothetical protein [Candidatus Helarchaeota archaeon]
MSALKIIGGILALIGGGFIVLQIIGFWPNFFTGDPDALYCLLTNIVIAGLAIVGGIIGRLGKRAGGILAIIAGVLAIVFGLITVYYTHNESVWPLSFFTSTYFWFTPPVHLFAGISIEALLILSGGILVVAGGSK